MQTVSDNWKQAHKRNLLNESFVEVSLNIADPDAIAVASSIDNGAIYISNSSGVTDGVDTTPTPYCTLEQNLWCLDGNRKAIPDSTFGDNGFVSDVLSDDACIFSTKLPILTITFGGVFNKLVPGVTITWSSTYGEFADTFSVIAYNGDNIVAEKEVVGNKSVKTLIFVDIIGYDRITVIVKKWCLPNHRARIEDILIGINKVYSKTDLFNYSHKQAVDPVSTSLPKTEIMFSVDNLNGEYNPYNPNGLAKYLVERQEVKARYGLKMDDGSIEWIKGGTFYLSEWYAKQNGITADFTARDLLEFMFDIYRETHDLSYRNLYDLATLILTNANLPLNSDGSVKWKVSTSLKRFTTNAPLPEDTLANCLQLIANVGCCTIFQDREGTLRIEPLQIDTKDYEINSFNSYSKPEVTLSKPIKKVIVKVYTYTGDTVSTTDFEVLGTGGEMGEVITIDNPLITSNGVASDVGQWMISHLVHRMTIDSSWRADVRLDALDIISSSNAYTTNKVRITDVEFKYNGSFRGTAKGKVIEDG